MDPTPPTPPKPACSIAVVMTVFNRREGTLRCLRALQEQTGNSFEMTVFVVDDGSTDGTSEAIARQFPEVRLLKGDGQLYWNGGMRMGLDAAHQEGFDWYCWLNDDVELDPDAISRLLDAATDALGRSSRPGILVGSMRDPVDSHLTYGGVRRDSPIRLLAFSLVEPEDQPIPAETMNGNFVLIPEAVVSAIGDLSPIYQQKMGDYDYGLRARQAGYAIWVAPGTYGTCSRHPSRKTEVAPLLDEIRHLWSVKELPFRPWAAYNRRWSGPLWPLYFVSPYIRGATRLMAERLRR